MKVHNSFVVGLVVSSLSLSVFAQVVPAVPSDSASDLMDEGSRVNLNTKQKVGLGVAGAGTLSFLLSFTHPSTPELQAAEAQVKEISARLEVQAPELVEAKKRLTQI